MQPILAFSKNIKYFFTELIMKTIIPVVMAGIIAIYGVVVSVLIAGELDDSSKYSLYK